MSKEFLTLLIFLFGSLTVILSVAVAFRFYQYRKRAEGLTAKLILAIMWQLIGEAVLGYGVLVFSFAAYKGWLPFWSIYTQSGIRAFLFGFAAITTAHLWFTLTLIEKMGR